MVINKEEWENKYDPKAQGPKAYMPAHDLTDRYESCAVVSNGGILLRDGYGAAIDAHQAVFRFNDGPTQGFEFHVGSKTTFRMINNNWARAWQHKRPKGTSEEAFLLFGIGAARSIDGLAKRWPAEKVYFISPEFAGNARGSYKKAYIILSELGFVEVNGRNSPPTGVEGLFLARALCDKVHLYGFSLEHDPSVPYHYHDKVKGVEAAHSFGFQSVFLNMLVKAGHFVLCTPGHASPDCNMGLT
mmetsp:Transcript_18843/g.26107  ORF Transcript_18843/g.26107 Transcript_18843/m.26107 type:complete len:244 (+) Transcript_18843:3-734(+)